MMEWLNRVIAENRVYEWEALLDDWVFLAMGGFLLFELVRLALRKALSWNVIGDTVTNYVTLFAYLGLSFVLLGAFYVGAYYFVYEHLSLMRIPITPWSIALCVVLADLAYYWEHRFTHRSAWAGRPTPSTTARPTSTSPWPTASARWTGSFRCSSTSRW